MSQQKQQEKTIIPNSIVSHVQIRQQHGKSMISPWIRNMVDQKGQTTGSSGNIPMGQRHILAARRMLALNPESMIAHPDHIGNLGKMITSKYQNMEKLIHFSPTFSREDSSWSEVETVFPNQRHVGKERQPGEMGPGSVIEKFNVFPRAGQVLPAMAQPKKSGSTPILDRSHEKPRLPPKTRLFSRVQEISDRDKQISPRVPDGPVRNEQDIEIETLKQAEKRQIDEPNQPAPQLQPEIAPLPAEENTSGVTLVGKEHYEPKKDIHPPTIQRQTEREDALVDEKPDVTGEPSSLTLASKQKDRLPDKKNLAMFPAVKLEAVPSQQQDHPPAEKPLVERLLSKPVVQKNTQGDVPAVEQHLSKIEQARPAQAGQDVQQMILDKKMSSVPPLTRPTKPEVSSRSEQQNRKIPEKLSLNKPAPIARRTISSPSGFPSITKMMIRPNPIQKAAGDNINTVVQREADSYIPNVNEVVPLATAQAPEVNPLLDQGAQTPAHESADLDEAHPLAESRMGSKEKRQSLPKATTDLGKLVTQRRKNPPGHDTQQSISTRMRIKSPIPMSETKIMPAIPQSLIDREDHLDRSSVWKPAAVGEEHISQQENEPLVLKHEGPPRQYRDEQQAIRMDRSSLAKLSSTNQKKPEIVKINSETQKLVETNQTTALTLTQPHPQRVIQRVVDGPIEKSITGFANDTDSGNETQPAAEPVDYEKLAEDVFPLVKRLLAVEAERAYRGFH
jgi:hypothetical protein